MIMRELLRQWIERVSPTAALDEAGWPGPRHNALMAARLAVPAMRRALTRLDAGEAVGSVDDPASVAASIARHLLEVVDLAHLRVDRFADYGDGLLSLQQRTLMRIAAR